MIIHTLGLISPVLSGQVNGHPPQEEPLGSAFGGGAQALSLNSGWQSNLAAWQGEIPI